MLETQIEIITHYKFHTLPLLGDGADLVGKVKGWLSCNWEGEVTNYSKKEPKDFSPADKGTLSVFGLDENGYVIVGMALYDGDPRAKDILSQCKHYFAKRVKSTNGW